jgi:hypothetical protein
MSTVSTNLVTEILELKDAEKKKPAKKTHAAVKPEVKIINISPIKKAASKVCKAKVLTANKSCFKVISTARIAKTLKYLTDVSQGKLVPDIGETTDVVLLALQEAVASRALQKGTVKQNVVPADVSNSSL